MTTHFMHIKNVEPSFFVLCKDGKIRCKTKYREVVGSWSHSQPRKEHRARLGRHASIYATDIWEGGLNYKGSAFGYTRKEFLETLCAIVKQKGIEIITSKTDN